MGSRPVLLQCPQPEDVLTNRGRCCGDGENITDAYRLSEDRL